MVQLNIHPLSDFQRNSGEHMRRLKETGQPEVLTVDGRAELIVQDAASYQKLLEDLDYAQAVAGIRRGLESADRGEGRPMREALEELGRQYGIDLKPK